MAKFCTRCGREIQEGETCSCKATGFSMDEIINLLKGIFTKPKKAIESYTEKDNFLSSLILIGLGGLGSATFATILMKRTYDQTIGSWLSGFGSAEPSYVKIFFLTLLIFLASYFVIAFIIHLCGLLVKGNTDYKKCLNLVASGTFLLTIGMFLGGVMALLSTSFGWIIVIATAVLCILYLYQGFHLACHVDENYIPYLLLASVGVAYLIISLVLPRIIY